MAPTDTEHRQTHFANCDRFSIFDSRTVEPPDYPGANTLDFSLSEKQEYWLRRVREFMDSRIYPAVTAVRDEFAAMGADRWQPSRKIEELKAQAKREGLWTLFLPPSTEPDSAEDLV